MITIENLSVVIGEKVLLKEISLNIAPSKWSCLVGPNGAGKTTLLKVLLGVMPYSGSVKSHDKELFHNQHRNVAFVPQSPSIPNGISVSEYVSLGRAKRDGWGNESAKSRAKIQEILEVTQLFGMHKQHVAHLSGGEMQRALIARALAQEPEVILLDEPTSALDLHHQISVLNNIESLKNKGVTIISTMHDITLAAMYAEEIVVMQEGRVLLAGSADYVIHSAELRSAFDDRINVFTLDSGDSVIVAKKERG